MLNGKLFRLRIDTTGLGEVDGRRVAIEIPAEATIKVISEPRHGETMMDVLWDGHVVSVFAVDLEQRGTEIGQKPISMY